MAKVTMLGSKFAVPCRILKLTVGFIFNESNGLDKTLRINKGKKGNLYNQLLAYFSLEVS